MIRFQYIVSLLSVWALLFGFTVSAEAQIKSYSFQELDSLQQTEARPVAVFIHTDWCKFCQAMKHTVFENKKIQSLLNQNFYFIQLDAESKEEVLFQNHSFQFKPSGNGKGIHELAEQLASKDGETTFPTMCFLNSDYEIVFQYPGFMSEKTLLFVLNELGQIE